MQNILFFVAGAVVGLIIMYFIQRKKQAGKPETFVDKSPAEMKEIRTEARAALTERTNDRKNEVLDFMKSESVHRAELKECEIKIPSSSKPKKEEKGIMISDVKKLLGVSGNTARKYLNALESEKKIKQVGKTGRKVYYELTANK